jgi:hypothetical protein
MDLKGDLLFIDSHNESGRAIHHRGTFLKVSFDRAAKKM